jgi:hypothetical protein
MELVRGRVAQVTHLGDGLDPGVTGRALGHHKHPDGLDWTVLGLARARGPAAQCGPGRLDGIEGVGLAVVAPGLPVRPVDLDNLQALSPEEPGQSDAIGAGALDADLGHVAEPLEPGHQGLVAGGVRLK